MIVETVNDLTRTGKISSSPQDNAYATYAHLLKKEDGKINWSQTAEEIDRQIRALNPWPGVWTKFNGKRIKILEAQTAPSPFRETVGVREGFIIDRSGCITCGKKTTLQITKLQPENTKPMDFSAALNGGYIEIGKNFE
jgi:methionyl-tRNA formyltransferase